MSNRFFNVVINILTAPSELNAAQHAEQAVEMMVYNLQDIE